MTPATHSGPADRPLRACACGCGRSVRGRADKRYAEGVCRQRALDQRRRAPAPVVAPSEVEALYARVAELEALNRDLASALERKAEASIRLKVEHREEVDELQSKVEELLNLHESATDQASEERALREAAEEALRQALGREAAARSLFEEQADDLLHEIEGLKRSAASVARYDARIQQAVVGVLPIRNALIEAVADRFIDAAFAKRMGPMPRVMVVIDDVTTLLSWPQHGMPHFEASALLSLLDVDPFCPPAAAAGV